MQNYQQVAKFIRDQPTVTGASPFIEGPIVIETQRGERYSQIAAPFLRGIDSETNNQVSDLEKSVVTGDFESIDGNGLLIGSALANRLSLSSRRSSCGLFDELTARGKKCTEKGSS